MQFSLSTPSAPCGPRETTTRLALPLLTISCAALRTSSGWVSSRFTSALSSFWLGLTNSILPIASAALNASPELSTMQRIPCFCAAEISWVNFSSFTPGGRLPLMTRIAPDSISRTCSSSWRNSSSLNAAPGMTKRYCSPLASTCTCKFCRVQSLASTVATGTFSSANSETRCSPVAPPAGKIAVALPPRWAMARATLMPPPPGSNTGAVQRSFPSG